MIIRVKRSVISYQAGSGLNLNLAWTITQLLTLLKHTLDRSKTWIHAWIFSLSSIEGKRKGGTNDGWGLPFLGPYYVSRFRQSFQVLGIGSKAGSIFLMSQILTFPDLFYLLSHFTLQFLSNHSDVKWHSFWQQKIGPLFRIWFEDFKLSIQVT